MGGLDVWWFSHLILIMIMIVFGNKYLINWNSWSVKYLLDYQIDGSGCFSYLLHLLQSIVGMYVGFFFNVNCKVVVEID